MTEPDNPNNTSKVVAELAWDSAHFGFPVAKIYYTVDILSKMPTAMKALDQNHIRLAYLEVPKSAGIIPAHITSFGGKYINGKSHFETLLCEKSQTAMVNKISKNFDSKDRETLEKLALESGSYSRFALDRNFPDGCFRTLYRNWIGNSLNGTMADAVIVAERHGNIAGMITISSSGDRAKIGLFCVQQNMRGRGIGISLLNDAKTWSHEQGCKSIEVTTQTENQAAMTIYQKSNFCLIDNYDVYHFWR